MDTECFFYKYNYPKIKHYRKGLTPGKNLKMKPLVLWHYNRFRRKPLFTMASGVAAAF